MRVSERRTWIEKGNPDLSVNQQCQLIGLPKSSFYYQKKVDSSLDDAMMKVIDQLYLQDCTFGTRRYKEELKDYGYFVGRQKVRSLMRTMGICAVNAKPRTTVIDPTKYKYPYLGVLTSVIFPCAKDSCTCLSSSMCTIGMWWTGASQTPWRQNG